MTTCDHGNNRILFHPTILSNNNNTKLFSGLLLICFLLIQLWLNGVILSKDVVMKQIMHQQGHVLHVVQEYQQQQQQLSSLEATQQQQPEQPPQFEEMISTRRNEMNGLSSSAHCFYRDFSNHSNNNLLLPMVVEVFASYNRTYVYVVMESHKGCHRHDDNDDNTNNNNDTNNNHNDWSMLSPHDLFSTKQRIVTMDCIFELDGSHTKSHPIHPETNRKMVFVLIQCPVPIHLQKSLPFRGASHTTAFLTLQRQRPTSSTKTTRTTTTRQQSLQQQQELDQWSHLPICSHAWPSDDEEDKMDVKQTPRTSTTTTMGHSAQEQQEPQHKKYLFSVMTRVSLHYRRGSNNQAVSLNHLDFVTWIEYHIAMGIQHFYIYDDSPQQEQEQQQVNRRNSSSTTSTTTTTTSTMIRQWCQPFVQEGFVTYVQYPRNDLYCDENTNGKSIFYSAQILSTNAAIRRYEMETIWMGHWDVDEYLILSPSTSPSSTTTSTGRTPPPPSLRGLSSSLSSWSSPIGMFVSRHTDAMTDEVSFARLLHGPCSNHNNNNLNNNNKNNNNIITTKTNKNKNNKNHDPIQEKRQTIHYDDNNQTNQQENQQQQQQMALERKPCYNNKPWLRKGLYRTSTILFFKIHKAQLRLDYTIPQHNNNNNNNNRTTTTTTVVVQVSDGYLAHVQEQGTTKTTTTTTTTNGTKTRTTTTNPLFPFYSHAFQKQWIPYLRQRVTQRFGALQSNNQ